MRMQYSRALAHASVRISVILVSRARANIVLFFYLLSNFEVDIFIFSKHSSSEIGRSNVVIVTQDRTSCYIKY